MSGVLAMHYNYLLADVRDSTLIGKVLKERAFWNVLSQKALTPKVSIHACAFQNKGSFPFFFLSTASLCSQTC